MYQWIAQSISRFLPVAALVGFNMKLIFKFRRILFQRNQMTANSERVSSTGESRLLFLLGCMVCLFTVCIIPAGVFILAYHSSLEEENFTYQLFRTISNALELFNGAVIFFLFSLCNGDIHQRLCDLVRCQFNFRQILP